MKDDASERWLEKPTAGTAKAVTESPCERMDRYRRVHAQMAEPYPATLQRVDEAELHNEAEAAGTPCPCGRTFAKTVLV